MTAAQSAEALLITLAIVCCSCGELLVPEAEPELNMQDFEEVWQIADTYYPFFAFKKVNWDSLHAVFKPRAASARGDEIYPVLFELLLPLRDSHIEVQSEAGYPVVNYRPARARDAEGYSPTVVRSYFAQPLRLAGGKRLEFGLLAPDIGYLRFTTFAPGDWVREVDWALSYLSGTSGLIVDVRNNSGGSSTSYDYVLARLIDRPIVETSYYWDGRVVSGMVQPATTPYRGNVVVLINGASLSAAETFAELLRQMPYVTVVGDTSGGSGGDARLFVLPSGKRLKLPVKYMRRLDGEMIEWNGVIPDVVVEQTADDVTRGRDPQLEMAIVLLRGRRPAEKSTRPAPSVSLRSSGNCLAAH
ncbi:MAG: hypothetical protein H5U38_14510 [Calditrichaeota bacterium]|nr:hypothetical protein [Calditrichota bacterium]